MSSKINFEKAIGSTNIPGNYNSSLGRSNENLIQANLVRIEKICEGKLLISVQKCAELLGVSYDFINKHIKCGKIFAVPMGDRRLIPREEIARLMSEGVK